MAQRRGGTAPQVQPLGSGSTQHTRCSSFANNLRNKVFDRLRKSHLLLFRPRSVLSNFHRANKCTIQSRWLCEETSHLRRQPHQQHSYLSVSLSTKHRSNYKGNNLIVSQTRRATFGKRQTSRHPKFCNTSETGCVQAKLFLTIPLKTFFAKWFFPHFITILMPRCYFFIEQ